MNLYCKLIGHTYVYKTDVAKIAWNAGKDMTELHMTSDEVEPRRYLECARCGDQVDEPSPEQVKLTGCNAR